MLYTAILWAVIGAFLRALIGLSNSVRERRKIIWGFFALTLAVGAVLGGVISALAETDSALTNFFIGVGGTYLFDRGMQLLKFMPLKIGVK